MIAMQRLADELSTHICATFIDDGLRFRHLLYQIVHWPRGQRLSTPTREQVHT